MRTPRFSAALAGCLMATILVGCGDDGPADPGKTGDKQITVYSGRNEALVKPVIQQFERATGVRVHVRYSDTAQLAAQLTEEGGKSPADVFLAQDAGALGTVTKRGLFATLDADIVGRVPAEYRARDNTWVGVTGRARTLVYDPQAVPDADLPKSVFELTGPKWRGKVGVAPTNASFQAFVTAVRVKHGDAKATEFLRGLKANDPQIRGNNVLIVADVNDGKLPVGLVNHYYLFEQAREKGVPVEGLRARNHFFRGGDPGGLVNVSGIGVLKKAAQDADARAFADYLLGTAGQTFFAQTLYEYPLVASVTTAAGLPTIASLDPPEIDLNDLNTLDQTVKMIKDAGLV